jgi:CRISPR-associated endonuclease Csy4
VVFLEKAIRIEMMKSYLEITLLPSVEIPVYFLWEKVYQQIHLALVEIQDVEGKVKVGSSFPEYDAEQHQLGRKLRLLAESSKELEDLNILKSLSRLTDYVHITRIRDVPKNITDYAFFKRIQTKSSNARLAKRKAKREGISYGQALQILDKHKEQTSKAPYINIKSLSSDKRYRLMIDCVSTEQSCNTKSFSTYGLSAKSCVPIF